MVTVPAATGTRPAMTFSSVVFPQPLAPIKRHELAAPHSKLDAGQDITRLAEIHVEAEDADVGLQRSSLGAHVVVR
jgi:hypothetical protein